MHFNQKKKKTQILIFIAFSLLFITLLISLLAVTFKELTLTRTNQRNELLAFSIAQAGLERAKAELRSNWNWTGTGVTPVNFGGGTYRVTVTVVGAQRRVQSQGITPAGGTTQRVIQCNLVQLPAYGMVLGTWSEL